MGKVLANRTSPGDGFADRGKLHQESPLEAQRISWSGASPTRRRTPALYAFWLHLGRRSISGLLVPAFGLWGNGELRDSTRDSDTRGRACKLEIYFGLLRSHKGRVAGRQALPSGLTRLGKGSVGRSCNLLTRLFRPYVIDTSARHPLLVPDARQPAFTQPRDHSGAWKLIRLKASKGGVER